MARRNNRSRPRPQQQPPARTGSKPPPIRGERADGRRTWITAPRTPDAIEYSLNRGGMDSAAPFGPGRPLNPYQGYSQPPRAMDYPVGVNISTRTRASWGLPSYETIRAIIKAYDIARICVNHKIDELRSMEPMFLPATGIRGDVSAAVDAARAALAYPDRELAYDVWLSKWLENLFKFDSAPLYRRRNYDGDVIGLESLDGTTIMPYIDERGRRPSAPEPAYYQLVHGQVWNWYTHQDITYCMFRPQEDAPFGTAPMESILLTANTDIRFQWHFLQMFTDGSVPAGFVELPPDISSPDQVAEWQDYWDAMVVGDQAKLHQLIAVPSGTKVTNTRPESFDSAFPEYLMARTCAAHGIVPQDIGLVKDVNRANGETQTDIQFRINTLPGVRYVEGVLSRYVQHDLGLPVQVKLNTGRDVEDRVQVANAWKIYIETGMASPDEGRSEVLGLPIDNDRPTPRFFNNTRLGPIPLPSIEAVAGRTDSETYGPSPEQPPLDEPYAGVIGVIPQVGTSDQKTALTAVDAEQQHHRDELDADRTASPSTVPTPADPQVATVGKTAARPDVDAELAAFGRYAKARASRGRWRDFQFSAVDPVTAHRLNDGGRLAVRKALGAVAVAGLAVRARDTGRVLMLQRGLDDTDPAAGMWEFPGGHLEDGESPLAAAVREWSEETGILLAAGDPAAQWDAGVYRGFVLDVPGEASVPVFSSRDSVVDPDDPDGDLVQALAWWDPSQLPGNPAVRAELAACLDVVLPLLTDDGGAAPGVCGCCNGAGGHGDTPCGCCAPDAQPGQPCTCGIGDDGVVKADVGVPDATGREVYEQLLRDFPADRIAWVLDTAWTGPRYIPLDEVDFENEARWAAAIQPARVDKTRRKLKHGVPVRPAVLVQRTGQPGAMVVDGHHRALAARDLHRPLLAYVAHTDATNGPWDELHSFQDHDQDGKPDAPTKPGKAAKKRRKLAKADGVASRWPGWQRDRQLVAHYADRIRTAMTGAVPADQVARRWLNRRVRKAAGTPTPGAQTAAQWLTAAGYLTALENALNAILTDAWTEGTALGVLSATAAAANPGVDVTVDWSGWTPGDPEAADLVLGDDAAGAGLAQLLDGAAVRIRSLGAGRIDDLARALALALDRGDSADTLAADLADILDNASWADLVAVTEICRATSAAAMQTYRDSGIGWVEWMSADDARVCPYCEDNEGAGPVRIGDAFPSGDAYPPGHPRCRCALVASIEGTTS